MPYFRGFALFLLAALLPIHSTTPVLAGPPKENDKARTLAVKNQQDSVTLRVSASGRTGLVEIRNSSGMLVETLACPLLRDSINPSPGEITGVAERFVAGFQTDDLDLDGFSDLRGPREFGASWTRDCVWLYDKHSRTFTRNPLAEQMEILYNLRADSKRRRIISSSIRTVDPLWDEYQIEGVSNARPYWPRLVPVKSCFIQSGSGDRNAMLITLQFEGRQPTVTRAAIRAGDKRTFAELCGK